MNYWQWSHNRTRLVYGDEVFIMEQKGVALYDHDDKTSWEKGKLSLTTHHIIFRPKGEDAAVLLLPLKTIARSQRPLYTVKGIAFSSDKIVLPLPGEHYCKLSFREGGMRVFYDALVHALQRHMWQAAPPKPEAANGAAATPSTIPVPSPHAPTPSSPQGAAEDESAAPASRLTLLPGIAGIVQASTESARLKDRLSDIDDVMLKASTLVESIRALKQRAVLRTADSEADTLAIESIEATLGLGTLVQRRAVRVEGGGRKMVYDSARKFHEELANELHAWMVHTRNAAHFGRVPLIPLMELFSLYNRARSGDLVSPEDVLAACRIMTQRPESQYTMCTLASGRKALVNKDVSITLALLARRLGPRVVVSEGAAQTTESLPQRLCAINEVQMAGLLSCAVAVARDVLDDLEQRGYLCRSDEGFGCCLYYWNIFV